MTAMHCTYAPQARRFVPPQLPLVQLCGCAAPPDCSAASRHAHSRRGWLRYTLGGLYLARYDDSPVGAFDEVGLGAFCAAYPPVSQAAAQAVALAGLVWNPPTSCAWAAKVYVSNDAARKHGVRVRSIDGRHWMSTMH